MFGVASDEGFDKGGLADPRRTNDDDDNWRRLFRQAIDERDMKTFLSDLELSSMIRIQLIRYVTSKISHKAHLHRVSAQLVLPIDLDLHSQKLWDCVLLYASSSLSSCDEVCWPALPFLSSLGTWRPNAHILHIGFTCILQKLFFPWLGIRRR